MTRQARQEKLLELIEKHDIDTQQELTELLKLEGFKVTQATVSRDIQELGLQKTASGGKAHYVKPLDPKLMRLKILFHQSVLSIDSAENFIVLKTINGSANSAAILIDSLENRNIMGTIAGDDTILIIIRDKSEVSTIVKQLTNFLE